MIVGGDHTNGALGLSELTVPAVWGGPPEHIHRHFEKMFYVLEGTLELLVGDEKVNASAGTFVIVPRGVVHKLSKRDNEPTRWLEFFVPAGFEQFFEQLATGIFSISMISATCRCRPFSPSGNERRSEVAWSVCEWIRKR